MNLFFTLFCSLCIAGVPIMNAQSVSLFNVDASGFPTVKAKFYAFDADNKQQRPSAPNFISIENRQLRTNPIPYNSPKPTTKSNNLLSSTLRLVQPNGGEFFVTGSDMLITWQCNTPSDTMLLELSVDNGATWNILTNEATGLRYIWKKIPRLISSQCLVRISQAGKKIVDTSGLIRTLTGHTNSVNGVAFSSDGSRIVTASDDQTAVIWDVNKGTPTSILKGHINGVVIAAFSPDGSKVATVGFDKTIKIWDVQTGGLIRTLIGHTNEVRDVAFNPDGSKIATASTDYTARVWEVNTGAPILTIIGHNNYVYGVAFSPDGNKIATASFDQTAKIWDANTGLHLHTLSGHSSYVSCVVFSPDGSKIATSGYDQIIKIWDANTGFLLQSFSGKSGKVNRLAFSPDGKTIATACEDYTTKIWDVNTTGLLRTLIGHARGVNGVAFSPDGSKIASASNDKTAKIWEVSPPTSVQSDTSDTIFNIVAPIVISQDVDMLQCFVGTKRDSLIETFVRNVGLYPFRLDSIAITGIDASQFSLVSSPLAMVVPAKEFRAVTLRFQPTLLGLKTAQLVIYTQSDTLHQVIIGLSVNEPIPDTARTTIKAQDITAQAGEKVNLTLKLFKPSGMQAIGAPTDWQARIHYNKSILFTENSSDVCTGTTDSCVLELTGVYNPKTEELISIPCITTLGNTDHSTIVIDTFYWKNSAIVTEVATQNGSITLNGVCEDGGVRLFIPAKNSTSLSTRPNPAQDNLQILYGLREPLTVTLELLTMTGQVVQTILNTQAQVAGQYTLTSDLSVLGNGVYLLRLRTNKEMLTTRVDVVK